MRSDRSWQRERDAPLTIGINLSGRAVDLADIHEMVLRALRESALSPTQLEIELTESVLMERSGKANALVLALKALGVRVSIDDFGTGYSSLAYIKTFAIDTLKIDRSFVHDLPADANGAAIARAIVAMARTLNLRVVAEGVETREQYDFLLGAGCDAMQGFLFGRAVPASEFARAFGDESTHRSQATVEREPGRSRGGASSEEPIAAATDTR